MDERKLIEALARVGTSAGVRGPHCLSESELAAYADGALDETRRSPLESHVADCDFCVGQIAFLLRAAELPVPTPAPAALVVRARRLVRRPAAASAASTWGLRAAAAAAVALAASVALRPPTVELPGTSPAVRTGGEGAARVAVQVPREGARVSADAELRWTAVERALFYELMVVTDGGDVVWERRSTAPRARLAADPPLTPGRRYYLWVVAHLPEGNTLRSPAVGFEIDVPP